MILIWLAVTLLVAATADANSDYGYCDASGSNCDSTTEFFNNGYLLFYDVNPPEGFNLRRDVYMRFAIFLSEAKSSGRRTNWRLVLPPWYNLYHWRNERSSPAPLPWTKFFDVSSLKSYAPVMELEELLNQTRPAPLKMDVVYVLQNFENAFENGNFEDKWQIVGNCKYEGNYWGYSNITAKEVICVRFQGKISQLWQIFLLQPSYRKVMIVHGEIPLHENYGDKSYWDCRKSMKFNPDLVKVAKNYISSKLGCKHPKCTSFAGVHWRRRDFADARSTHVPSIEGTAKQIDKMLLKRSKKIKKVFIATDASENEYKSLETHLIALGYKVFRYVPSKKHIEEYKEGGIAIIDQIICSHSAFFIGTHESTFSYRIQEEREIIGFDSSTTFNRLCPDEGECEAPSKWNIVD